MEAHAVRHLGMLWALLLEFDIVIPPIPHPSTLRLVDCTGLLLMLAEGSCDMSTCLGPLPNVTLLRNPFLIAVLMLIFLLPFGAFIFA